MRPNRMTNQLNFIGAIAAYILHFFVNILGYVAHMFLGNDVIVARGIVKATFVCWNVNKKGLAFPHTQINIVMKNNFVHRKRQ